MTQTALKHNIQTGQAPHPEPDRLDFAKTFADKLNESRLWKIKISYQKRWTKHRRTQKSLEIQTTKPWRYATGPKTPAGKSRTANNAGKGQGRNAYNRLVAKIMSDHSRFLREALMACGARPWDGRKPLKTIRECVEEAALHEIRLAALAATQNVNFLKALTIVT